jgi:excisionase family DNA binding protein
MALSRSDFDEEILTTEEVCKLLRVSRQTIYKLVDQGKLPGTKVGQSYKFLKSELIGCLKGGGAQEMKELKLLGPNELELINP